MNMTNENELTYTPTDCIGWLLDYAVSEIETDYEPQKKWCIGLIDGAIYLMREQGLSEMGRYNIADLVALDREHRALIADEKVHED